MFSQKLRSLILAVVCVAVVGIVASGAAAAQDNESETEIELNDPDLNQSDFDQTTYSEEIDPDTRLVDWRYNDDREGFELLFETDSRTTITLTEAVQFDEGSGSGRIYQQRLPRGMTEVFVSVPRRGGEAAVTMTTPGSIAQNRFSYVSTGMSRDRPPISYERAQLLVILTGVSVAVGTVTIIKRRREDEDKKYERVL